MEAFEKPVLRVKNLKKQFGAGCDYCKNPDYNALNKNYCTKCGTVYAISDISFDLYKGEVLGIVGESGSGKSTMMQSLYFDKEVSGGQVFIESYKDGKENVLNESDRQKRYIRNNLLGKVYQNPILGLQMKFSAIGNIAERLIAARNRNVSKMIERAEELLNNVNIPIYRMKESPSSFSGGMQQRVQIAKALSTKPSIILLDEVTTGLDLSVQANVLDLIKKLQRENNISMIVVSHDLGVIRMLCDRTLVMLNGRVVEEGLTDQILQDPQNEYTQELVQSLL